MFVAIAKNSSNNTSLGKTIRIAKVYRAVAPCATARPHYPHYERDFQSDSRYNLAPRAPSEASNRCKPAKDYSPQGYGLRHSDEVGPEMILACRNTIVR